MPNIWTYYKIIVIMVIFFCICITIMAVCCVVLRYFEILFERDSHYHESWTEGETTEKLKTLLLLKQILHLHCLQICTIWNWLSLRQMMYVCMYIYACLYFFIYMWEMSTTNDQSINYTELYNSIVTVGEKVRRGVSTFIKHQCVLTRFIYLLCYDPRGHQRTEATGEQKKGRNWSTKMVGKL